MIDSEEGVSLCMVWCDIALHCMAVELAMISMMGIECGINAKVSFFLSSYSLSITYKKRRIIK